MGRKVNLSSFTMRPVLAARSLPELYIPFNLPSPVGSEAQYVTDAMCSGHLAGDGGFTSRCHALLERVLGVRRALLTTSCTDALEMAAILLDVSAGDEVILPTFTFVSVANAFVLRGARPVFADIRPDTLNLDETRLERLITARTKAIVVVHYGGVACEMDAILEIARRRNVPVIEDAAQGLFGRYRGRWLGSMGALGAFSFHGTKNFTCGEGGALAVNDAGLVERAEVIRQKGTNRHRFVRGEIDAYMWMDVGSSYLPSELLAAFLLAQLEARERVQAQRGSVWQFYDTNLRGWAADRGVTLPVIPPWCDQAYHLFCLLLPSREDRPALMAHLNDAGIGSAPHYSPLHLSPMGRQFTGRPGDCPVAEDVADRLLRLPFYRTLTDRELGRVVEALHRW